MNYFYLFLVCTMDFIYKKVRIQNRVLSLQDGNLKPLLLTIHLQKAVR